MFDRYRIEGHLGRGGMGEVYKAHDTRLGRTVALKLLAADHTTGDGRVRLLREARAAATILHPNAVAVFDVGEVAGVPYIAMEYVEGKTLRAYVGDHGVPIEARLKWLTDIAHGLAAAHEKGIVHRDIKPENVMITTEGLVKVLDFGLARAEVRRDDTALATITREGVVVGTLPYMAPEALRGEHLDGRSDQFSWGVVAYEMLTGHRPWSSTSDAELIAEILSSYAVRLDTANISDGLELVIRRALAPDRTARFWNMETVASAVAAAAQSGAGDASLRQADTTTLPHNCQPRRKSGARTVYAVVVLALSVVIAGFILWLRARPSRVSDANIASQDLVLPLSSRRSDVREVNTKYLSAWQSWRDADNRSARETASEVVQLDEGMAAAHLLIVLASSGVDETIRKHLRAANQYRINLDEVGGDLLGALEPAYESTLDTQESVRRLEAARDKYPHNAIVLDKLSSFSFTLGRFDAALKLSDEAIAADPRFARAWRTRSLPLSETGRFEEQRDAYIQCLRVSPYAADCLAAITGLAAAEGECESVRGYALRWRAIAQQDPRPLLWVASAEKYRNGNRDAADELFVLSQKLLTANEGEQSIREMVNWKILNGRWVDAERAVATWSDRLKRDGESRRPALDYELELDVELERRDEVFVHAQLYKSIIERASNAYELYYIVPDATLYLLGQIDRAEYIRRRMDWNGAVLHQFMPVHAYNTQWVFSYGNAMRTDADALEASHALKRVTVRSKREPPEDLALGRMYRRLNQIDEAVGFLRRAAQSCDVIAYPFETTRAQYEYASLLEARKDPDACKWYGRVLDRWGSETRSITARNAADRLKSLNCSRESAGD